MLAVGLTTLAISELRWEVTFAALLGVNRVLFQVSLQSRSNPIYLTVLLVAGPSVQIITLTSLRLLCLISKKISVPWVTRLRP